MTELRTRQEHWSDFRPWQTNAALALIGGGLIALTRQLIAENGDYHFGLDHVSMWSFMLYLAAAVVLWLKPANTDRYTFPIILGVAIACRIVCLFPDPFLSSDVYRYAWDGVVQHAHINPYRYVPGNAALTFLREPNQDLFDNMNRRDYAHTIYPPAAQIFFYLVTFLNGSVTMMKLAMVLVEGLTVTGLVLLLRAMGLRREWTILYAWSPLLIWEIGGSGHVDSLVMCLIVFALLFRYRQNAVLTGLFLGLAVLTKFYPLVLFPALWRRGDWKMPATMAALAVFCYSFYLSVGMGVFGFLGGYAQEEGMNTGARFWLLDATQRLPGLHKLPEGAFLVFAALVFGGLMVWAWRVATPLDAPRDAFLQPAMAFAFAMMLLFSPHYPWYVAWLFPFLVLVPNLTLMTYVGTLFYLCYTALATGFGEPQYHLNLLLYRTVVLAFVVELALRRWPVTGGWFRRERDLRVGVR